MLKFSGIYRLFWKLCLSKRSFNYTSNLYANRRARGRQKGEKNYNCKIYLSLPYDICFPLCNSNYVRNIHHFPPWRRWWPRQSPGNQSCTWKHLMMTVYWGRISEALSHWNKSCLVDFFHCSKNIRTLGCDTKVREEQHTVPTWILQRTPEISTAMNISRRTPQHSLPPCIRKTSSNSPSLPQVISKVTHLVS